MGQVEAAPWFKTQTASEGLSHASAVHTDTTSDHLIFSSHVNVFQPSVVNHFW